MIIILSGIDYMANLYVMSDVILKAAFDKKKKKARFSLIMTNDMCDLGSSRVLHHIQSCTYICSQSPPPPPLSLYFLHVIP